jgi:membrane protein YqaA with SNARE-associated domain
MGASEDQRPLRSIIQRTLLVAGAAFIIYGITAYFLRTHLVAAGIWMKEDFGLIGVGVYCFLVDMLIVPTTIDIIFPLTSDWAPVPLLTVMSAASMVGGFMGYLIAKKLDHLSFVHKLTRGYQSRGQELITRFGGWAVALAGFTPLPFSTICWIAGLLEVRSKVVLLAVLSRIPRIILYYYMIQGGIEILQLIPLQPVGLQ